MKLYLGAKHTVVHLQLVRTFFFTTKLKIPTDKIVIYMPLMMVLARKDQPGSNSEVQIKDILFMLERTMKSCNYLINDYQATILFCSFTH